MSTPPVDSTPTTEPEQQPADRGSFIPIDPPPAGDCVGIDPVTGVGSTQWTYEPCQVDMGTPPVPTTTAVVAVNPATQSLPVTGTASTIFMCEAALLLVLIGVKLRRFATR